MHVCLSCIELFGDSIYGGFGRATRFIGRELARRGVTVSVVVPRRSEARPYSYQLDGMTIHQFRPHQLWSALRIYRNCRADIYHSQDASSATFLAQLAAPRAAHVVTLRDPMDSCDWKVETEFAKQPRLGWAQYRYFIDNPLVTLAVKRAQLRFCAAEFLIPKVVALYGLKTPPRFLPSPVDVPAAVQKAARPTVCYVGRWEGRKRVELFFELAQRFPQVDFIAVGGARDAHRDRALRDTYGSIPNLQMTGVLDQFATAHWSEVLGQSWILVNTSLREGLPTTFIEAAAHRCAVLSFVDPQGFASQFGAVAQEGALHQGLEELLRQDRWRIQGEKGWRYTQKVFATENAINAHLDVYRDLLHGSTSDGSPS